MMIKVAPIFMVALATGHAAGAKGAGLPNVVIILVDDLGLSDVSFNARVNNQGSAAIDTPELDALAQGEQGVHLVNGYTHMLCGPSRAALMSGRLAYSLGNPFPMPLGGSTDKNVTLVSEEFKLRGYSTHIIGKWGIDYAKPATYPAMEQVRYKNFNAREAGYGPAERGFDTFYGIMSSGHNHFTKEVVFTGAVDWHIHNQTHKLDFPQADHEPNEYSTHLFTREAVRTISTWSKDKPGFLYLAYTAPHDPLQAPEEYLEIPQCKRMRNWRRRTFCGMVKAIDKGVGKVRQALEENGLADNTIIVFASDNGGAPSVGGYNYPYKGQKTGIYEGGVRTPAFFTIPPKLGKRASAKYEKLIHISDFAPTLLGLVDRSQVADPAWLHQYSKIGSDIQGVDHAPLMLSSLASGKPLQGLPTNPEQPHAKGIVLEYSAFFGHTAYVEEGRWKLILGNAGRSELFREPTGYWYDEDKRLQFRVEETICNVIDQGLGDNWFPYGWAFRALVDAISAIGKIKLPSKLAYAYSAPWGETIPITDDVLPDARWDLEGIAQLYDLRNDPFELNNIALGNRARVDQMTQRVRDKVRGAHGHHYSVQKQFLSWMFKLIAFFACSILAIFLVLFYVAYRCFSPRRSSRKQKAL